LKPSMLGPWRGARLGTSGTLFPRIREGIGPAGPESPPEAAANPARLRPAPQKPSQKISRHSRLLDSIATGHTGHLGRPAPKSPIKPAAASPKALFWTQLAATGRCPRSGEGITVPTPLAHGREIPRLLDKPFRQAMQRPPGRAPHSSNLQRVY